MLKAGLGSTEVCQYLTATHAQVETQRAGAHLPFVEYSPARPAPGNGVDPRLISLVQQARRAGFDT
jgi:hypothetical protein